MNTREALERAGAPPSGGGGGGGGGGGIVWVLAILVAVIVGAGLLMPCVTRGTWQARRAHSMSNLKQIGLALAMYADDNDGGSPATLDGLMDAGYVTDPQLFANPRGTDCGYAYVRPPEGLTFESPNAAHIAVAHGTDPQGEGGNVLFLDGHVTWYFGSDPVASARRAEERIAERGASSAAATSGGER